MYVAGIVAYDGTDYYGYQFQVGVPTIQGALETALQGFTAFDARVIGSGRTDTGVHANGQVIAAEVPWTHSPADLQRAWNAHLPRTIQVRRLCEATTKFHPRFSATARTYRYTVDAWAAGNAVGAVPDRSPLTDRFALYVPYDLNFGAMQQAAAYLLGEHDFATFGQPPQGENSVRTVMEARWLAVQSNLPPLTDLPGSRYVFTIRANAFLRRMVRSMVGTLLEVGRGRRQPEAVAEALVARDRSHAAPPAPPQGLVLERVEYPASVDPWFHPVG